MSFISIFRIPFWSGSCTQLGWGRNWTVYDHCQVCGKEGWTCRLSFPVYLFSNIFLKIVLNICYIPGSDDIEAARADLVAENANEVLCKYWDFRFEEDATVKARGMAAFKETVLPNFLKQNSAYYHKNGDKFANGKDVKPNWISKLP